MLLRQHRYLCRKIWVWGLEGEDETVEGAGAREHLWAV